TSVEANYLIYTGADPDRAEVLVLLPIEDGWAGVERLDSQIEATPGALSVHSRVTRSVVIDPKPGPVSGDEPRTLVTVGTCETLRELAALDSCADGNVFLIAASERNDFIAAPE